MTSLWASILSSAQRRGLAAASAAASASASASASARAAALMLAVAVLATPVKSWARKFDFKSESVATYFKGSYGPSQVRDAAFGDSSGASTSFDKNVTTNAGAEFGFLVASERLNLRLGAEILLPRHLSDVKGSSDTTGTELFSLDTKTSALIPTVFIDAVLSSTPTSKAFLSTGLGYAYVSVDNTYAFTADGTSEFGLANFQEKAKAEALAIYGSVGYETLFADNSTVVFELGYRYLEPDTFKHEKETTTFQGPVTAGELATTNNGDARKISLSGIFASLSFRFYIGL